MFPVPLAVKRLRYLATLNGRAIICFRSVDKAHPTPVTTDPFKLEEVGMKQRLRHNAGLQGKDQPNGFEIVEKGRGYTNGGRQNQASLAPRQTGHLR
jgi:hypothetical protein